MNSGIVAKAVAAEVTSRKCFSRPNPPPYVGGDHSGTHPGSRRKGWLAQARSAAVPGAVPGRRNTARVSGVEANQRAGVCQRRCGRGQPPSAKRIRPAPITTRAVCNTARSTSDVALLACLALAATVAASAGDRFNSAKLSQMDEEIQRAIAEHRLPGGVLWVECKGSNYHKAFGFRSVFPTPEAMTEDTVFDVASLTKVLATVPALMVLYERAKVKLEEPVVNYLPEFKGGGKEAITIRHLLTHTSGFGRGLSHEPDWFDYPSAFKMVCAETPSEPPGAAFLYSDLNFIILGEVLQRLAGMKLDEFCAREIFKPLKMVDTCFLPSEAVRSRIAPTEKVGRMVLRGTVHDFKAQGMGGVAGCAGGLEAHYRCYCVIAASNSRGNHEQRG